MRNGFLFLLGLALLGALHFFPTVSGEAPGDFRTGTPEIRSMSALAFGPDGILFIGDGKGGSVFALDLNDQSSSPGEKELTVKDVESKIGAFLGTTAGDVLIHDMAVNPLSKNVYLAVSRGRSQWDQEWLLPNDIADATVLVKVSPKGELGEVALQDVRFARTALPNPVSPDREHEWKEGINLRTDTITDMSYAHGTLYVAGLSNEEFASTLWRFPYPFSGEIAATTLENYHGAHGKYETEAPIRTFVPYALGGKEHILAAYLCTPLVTFPLADLKDGQHVKGRTVGEFGSGNYPLDMVLYKKDGKEKLLIANSDLPFMIVDPKDVESYQGAITEPTKTYVAGVRYEPRSGSGIQQMDILNSQSLLALRRHPGGNLDLITLSTEWF
ncbi:MAG: hypothetical protein ACRD3V_07830 [Vicinamibacteria bacterium]